MAGTAGYKAVLKLGGVTLGKCQDVNVSFNKTLAEASTRDGEGFRGKCPALKDISVSGTQLWVSDDTGLTTIMSAWFNDTLLAAEVTDIADGTGWTFNCFVGTLGKGEPLDGVQTLSFAIESDGIITPNTGS